jgi:ABC-type nitrate/sulfonate/bicarbonate transport system permease component
LLPSPFDVVLAFIDDFYLLLNHSKITLLEAFLGLFISLILAFMLSVLMDINKIIKKVIYPLLVISQTVPVIAIAPLLVLWFGYGITPKILLIVLVCFFPLTVSLTDGFASVNEDYIKLLKSMGAKKTALFYHLKLPMSLNHFFAGLKIAVSYSVVGAVISEWLGGESGLGVYMTRVRKSYSYDKMFAVIFLISVVSILLVRLTDLVQKKLKQNKGR